MEVTGILKLITKSETVGESLRIRSAVVTTPGEYSQDLPVKFFGDKCDILDKYKEGDRVEIGVNLRGYSFTNSAGDTKYGSELIGWRVSKVEEVKNESVTDPVEELTTDDLFN